MSWNLFLSHFQPGMFGNCIACFSSGRMGQENSYCLPWTKNAMCPRTVYIVRWNIKWTIEWKISFLLPFCSSAPTTQNLNFFFLSYWRNIFCLCLPLITSPFLSWKTPVPYLFSTTKKTHFFLYGKHTQQLTLCYSFSRAVRSRKV